VSENAAEHRKDTYHFLSRTRLYFDSGEMIGYVDDDERVEIHFNCGGGFFWFLLCG